MVASLQAVQELAQKFNNLVSSNIHLIVNSQLSKSYCKSYLLSLFRCQAGGFVLIQGLVIFICQHCSSSTFCFQYGWLIWYLLCRWKYWSWNKSNHGTGTERWIGKRKWPMEEIERFRWVHSRFLLYSYYILLEICLFPFKFGDSLFFACPNMKYILSGDLLPCERKLSANAIMATVCVCVCVRCMYWGGFGFAGLLLMELWNGLKTTYNSSSGKPLSLSHPQQPYATDFVTPSSNWMLFRY